MKKVLIIEASAREGFSSAVAQQMKEAIGTHADVELIRLREYDIARCKGCCACLTVGSASCPLKEDDVRTILDKLEQANGVVFVVPNYSLAVPGILKDVFDRLAFVFHRPRLFGRVCMPVVVQGVYGGNKVAKYINEVLGFWGMNEVKGAVISGGVFPDPEAKQSAAVKNNPAIAKASVRFMQALANDRPVSPSLFKLVIFRMTRSGMKYFAEALPPDKQYYQDRGWLTADYYYPVPINPIKKIVGRLSDQMMKNMAKKQN
jgi:multimeric flavodoxin WrbA